MCRLTWILPVTQIFELKKQFFDSVQLKEAFLKKNTLVINLLKITENFYLWTLPIFFYLRVRDKLKKNLVAALPLSVFRGLIFQGRVRMV